MEDSPDESEGVSLRVDDLEIDSGQLPPECYNRRPGMADPRLLDRYGIDEVIDVHYSIVDEFSAYITVEVTLNMTDHKYSFEHFDIWRAINAKDALLAFFHGNHKWPLAKIKKGPMRKFYSALVEE